jgi:hypothetical protein
LDLPIYTQALQRSTHVATLGHAAKLNRIVEWLRRKDCVLTYHAMQPGVPQKTLMISDAAFRREDPSCLAMRGAIVALAERHDASASPGGILHVIEYYLKRQRRIVRSTFGAEVQAVSDAVEVGRLVNFSLCSLRLPGVSARELQAHEDAGSLPLQLEAVVDCLSIQEHVKGDELKVPTEASLLMVLSAIKQSLMSSSLRRLWWCDTTDMLTDGLNKGAVPRTQLLATARAGAWWPVKPMRLFQEVRHTPVTTASQFAQQRATASPLVVEDAE